MVHDIFGMNMTLFFRGPKNFRNRTAKNLATHGYRFSLSALRFWTFEAHERSEISPKN